MKDQPVPVPERKDDNTGDLPEMKADITQVFMFLILFCMCGAKCLLIFCLNGWLFSKKNCYAIYNFFSVYACDKKAF